MRFLSLYCALLCIALSFGSSRTVDTRDLGFGVKQLIDELIRIVYPDLTGIEATISALESLNPNLIVAQVGADLRILGATLIRLEKELGPLLIGLIGNNQTLFSVLETGVGEGGRGIGTLARGSSLGGITETGN